MRGLSKADLLEERLKSVNHRVSVYFGIFCGLSVLVLGFLSWIGKEQYELKSQFSALRQQVADTTAKSVSSLLDIKTGSPEEVSKKLQAASTLLETAKVGKLRPDKSSLQAVSQKLVHVQEKFPNVPEVWGATAQLVNYKSQVLLPVKLDATLQKVTEPCSRRILNPVEYVDYNCVVDLDKIDRTFIFDGKTGRISPAPMEKATVTFINCRVRYHGTPLHTYKLIFVNCILEFSINEVPDQNIQLALKQLTKANSSEVTITT